MRQAQYAGEGELHSLLRESGLTLDEFLSIAGIHRATFDGWYGHPLHHWPIALLEHVVWARNMAAFLSSKGWDPVQFKPKGLPPAPGGRYARTKEQGAELLAGAGFPDQINCPVHGWQKALGGECSLC